MNESKRKYELIRTVKGRRYRNFRGPDRIERRLPDPTSPDYEATYQRYLIESGAAGAPRPRGGNAPQPTERKTYRPDSIHEAIKVTQKSMVVHEGGQAINARRIRPRIRQDRRPAG